MIFTVIVSLWLHVAPIYCQTCQDAPFNTYPYCNYTLPIDERVNDLFSRLTLEEKITLTNSDQGGVSRLALPTLGHTECTHGTFQEKYTPLQFPTTLFPQAITIAQSFDPPLVGRIARAISDEVRGKYNDAKSIGEDPDNYYGLVCWAPVVNICRDPRWGRCQEGYGEDPFLQAQFAKHYIPNIQHDDTNPNVNYMQAVSTCKHFDAHTGPENHPSNRYSFDAVVKYRDWIDTFQPAFKACHTVNVSSYMCSYNEINGIPACGNGELLQDILRDEWGFDGYVVSDCGAIPNIYSQQKAVRNYEEAAEMAIKAGCDWAGICSGPGGALKYLLYAVQNGTLPLSYVDNAVKRVLPYWFKLGLLDPPSMNPWLNYTLQTLWPKHRNLSLEASLKSMVLVKNDNNVLPINFNNYNNWLVIGPCINNTVCYSGDYNAHPPFISTPLEALMNSKNSIGNSSIKYDSVCSDGPQCSVLSNSSIENVISLVKQSDAILFVGGISYEQEAETRDRTEIELPSNQSLLFKYIATNAVNNQPIISVLTYGAPTVDKYLFNRSNAIIGAGYSGQMFGEALISLLNGSYAPVGRISTTWYQNTSQLPDMINYDMMYPPGRTYKYLTQMPIYSFGYGLSYVDFEYSNLVLVDSNSGVNSSNNGLVINPCDSVTVLFNIKNNGNNVTNYGSSVDEISQVYLRVLNNTVETDNIRLVNFTRSEQVALSETRQIKLQILAEQMTVTKDLEYTEIIETGQYQVIVTSSLTLDVTGEYNDPSMLKQTFKVGGTTMPLSKC